MFDAGRITSYWNQDEKGMGAEQAKWLGAQCGEKRIVDTQADRSSVKQEVSMQELCPGQVFSDTAIGCLIADCCSKALGGKLPSLECSRTLL